MSSLRSRAVAVLLALVIACAPDPAAGPPASPDPTPVVIQTTPKPTTPDPPGPARWYPRVIVVSWDANAEPDLAGYRVRLRRKSEQEYRQVQDTAYTVYRDDADEDTCYRVSAYDTSMNFSEEAEFCYVGQAN